MNKQAIPTTDPTYNTAHANGGDSTKVLISIEGLETTDIPGVFALHGFALRERNWQAALAALGYNCPQDQIPTDLNPLVGELGEFLFMFKHDVFETLKDRIKS